MRRRERSRRSPSRRVASLGIALALATIAACAFALPLPFDGDQALFALGAREMLGGAILYVDFWDLKQPAIYWFFAAARACFGGGALGAHALEALWNVALAVVAALAVRRALPRGAAWFVAPALAVAYATIVRGPNGATQVEALVALPLLVALWSFVEALDDRVRARALFVVAGFAAAIVALFKLLLVVAVLAAWTCALASHVGARARRRDVAGAALAIALGFAVPSGLAVAWFAAHGALGAAFATWFVVPPEIVRELPHQSVAILRDGFVERMRLDAPLVPLALFGAASAVRERRALLAGALGWIVGGGVAIVLQVTSWWAYQWELLDVPLALLATLGVVRLAGFARRGIGTALVAASLCVVLVAYPIARARERLALVVRDGFGATATGRDRIADAAAPASARARAAAAAIGRVADGDLYAFGNASIYDALGVRQPIALNGYSPELLVATQRTALLRDLQRVRPRLVYVADDARSDVDRLLTRSPEIGVFLRHAYVARRLRDGTLFERRSSRGGPIAPS